MINSLTNHLLITHMGFWGFGVFNKSSVIGSFVEVPRNSEVTANVIQDVHLLPHFRIELIDEVSLGLHLLLNSCIPGN